jgi:hypothetical protein
MAADVFAGRCGRIYRLRNDCPKDGLLEREAVTRPDGSREQIRYHRCRFY